MNDDDIYDYLFSGGEDAVTPTYADVPTFDASSLSGLGFDLPDLSSIVSSLPSLKADISLSDLLGKDTFGFGTQYGLNPSQSRDLYEGINFEKMSDVGELNDIAAAGKVTAEEAVRSGNPLLAGTIITPQEALDYGIDVNTLLPVASDVVSPKLAKIYEDFGLSSTGAASGVVDPNTAKFINDVNKLVTGDSALSKTGAIYPGGTGGGGVINKTETVNKIQEAIRNLVGGKDNAALIAALLGGLLGLAKSNKGGGRTVGYQGGAGKPLTATRQALSPSGAPGSGGRRFMTDVTYAAEGGLMEIAPPQPNESVTFMAAGGLPDKSKYMSGLKNLTVDQANKYDQLVGQGYSPSDAADVAVMARGGLSDLGGYTHAKGGRMLKGPGDGMSDSIPATIEGKRPARLANDEFVVPADVVSHLGNGSSDAGANVLYDMMARVRKARTGNPDQGKQINPKKYLPR